MAMVPACVGGRLCGYGSSDVACVGGGSVLPGTNQDHILSLLML